MLGDAFLGDPGANSGLTIASTLLYAVDVKKDLTAVRLRPEQVAELRKLAARDKETSVSSLIRRAVDEFIAKEKKH